MTDYVLEGPKWGSAVAGAAGGLVTWAMDASVPAAFASVLTAAFSDWSAHANIGFTQVAAGAAHQITFSLGYIDGPSNVLGQTTYNYASNGLFTSAAVAFDSGEGWHLSGANEVSNSGINLFVVALHEIGHALGLDHYNATPAVMNAYLNRTVTDLTTSDIDGIRALYGAAPNANLFGATVTSPASAAGSIYGLYRAVLGHAPDALGLETFTNALAGGATLAQVASALLASPEYAAQHPGGVSNTAFIAGLYGNLLNRAPDAAGQAAFLGELNAGVDRGTVATQVATSAEAQANLAPVFQAGVFVPDATDAAVARLYYGVLGRAPDANGLAGFEAQARAASAGTLQGLTGVAQAMLASAEYTATRGTLSDAAFIDSLYLGALGRHADAGGAAGFGAELAQGTARAVVAVQIAESPEAQVHLVGQIEQGHALIG